MRIGPGPVDEWCLPRRERAALRNGFGAKSDGRSVAAIGQRFLDAWHEKASNP